MLVAKGKADYYLRFAPIMEWDTAAAHAIEYEVIEPTSKKPLVYNKEDLLNLFFNAIMLQKLKKILTDTDSKEILTKGFSFMVFRVGGLLAGYLFTFLIARFYGASVNGLVALSFTLFLFVSIFGRLGIDVNIVKFYSNKENWEKYPDLFYRVLLKSFIFSTVLGFLLYLGKDFFVYILFKKPDLEPYIIWVVMAIPFWCVTMVCAGLLRAKQKNNWFAFLNNPGRFILALIVFLILISLGHDSLSAIKAHFYGVFCLAIIAILVSVKNIGRFTHNTDSNSWGFIKEALPMMLSSTILIFLGWLDTFFLGIYETEAQVGVYSVTLKIATLTSLSLQAINSILAPKLAKNFQEGSLQHFKKLIRFSTHLNFYITALIVFLIIVLHRWILGVFGDEFLGGATVLIILCIGQVVNSMSGSVGVILQMMGYQRIYQNIVLIALVLNLILNLLLVPLYGTIGAAIATVVSISCWNIIGAIYLKRKQSIISYFKL
nr:oligosaccharide flippase family protein [uncultured Allomuricauda sp.]